MPCYLFTYHGHATWMPDHPRGYVHRQRGLQKRDANMARHYRAMQRESKALFDAAKQELLVATAQQSGKFIHAKVHAAATEPTHLHVLVSWRHQRTWLSMRAGIRSAMSRAMNHRFGRRTWFSDSPSRKRVNDYEHFDYLMLKYLPKHSGVKWFNEQDVERAKKRHPQFGVKRRKLR